jgi:transposase-like protein
MRNRNWREYNKKLVQRGSLTFLVDPKIIKTLEVKAQKKKKGRPLEFSDQLILILLMIKIHYKMPYRMLEGFTRFFFEQFKKIKVPTYSLTCKRAKGLSTKLPHLSSRKSKTIIVDATGIKVQGEGEWKVKIHGKGRPRKWIKLHVAIDEATQEIVAEISTDATVDDGKAFPKVMQQVRGRPKLVIGDGAYDDRDVRDLIREKGGKCLIPPPSNAVCHGTDLERDEAIKMIRGFGGDKVAKSIWGKMSGYSRRALVETTFSRYKKMFGERAFSRTQERIMLENRLKCVLLNKMMRSAP